MSKFPGLLEPSCAIVFEGVHYAWCAEPKGIMKNTLLLVIDLAGLKAFKLENSAPHRTTHLVPIAQLTFPAAHARIVDQVTDFSGRFPRGVGNRNVSHAMSDGERHNIELEQRRRLIRLIARQVNQLAMAQEFESCLLAASREINQQLIAELHPRVRAKIAQNVPADLTKVARADLLRHF